jgi:hypothetical protein
MPTRGTQYCILVHPPESFKYLPRLLQYRGKTSSNHSPLRSLLYMHGFIRNWPIQTPNSSCRPSRTTLSPFIQHQTRSLGAPCSKSPPSSRTTSTTTMYSNTIPSPPSTRTSPTTLIMWLCQNSLTTSAQAPDQRCLRHPSALLLLPRRSPPKKCSTIAPKAARQPPSRKRLPASHEVQAWEAPVQVHQR